MFSTSEFLIDILNDFDRSDAESEKKQLKEILQKHQLEDEELMKSVEGLCSGTPLSVLGWPSAAVEFLRPTGLAREILESSLDHCFCRTLVKQIPTMVSRALRLEPLVISEYTKGSVNVYLREATRTYLLGLFIASVALSRSTLEQALEEKVSKVLQTDSKEGNLKKLVDTAGLEKLLHGDLLCLAHRSTKICKQGGAR